MPGTAPGFTAGNLSETVAIINGIFDGRFSSPNTVRGARPAKSGRASKEYLREVIKQAGATPEHLAREFPADEKDLKELLQ